MSRFFVLLLAVVLVPIWGTDTSARRPKRPQVGHLLVESISLGADIYVDGIRIGRVPQEKPYRLTAGEHTVRLSLEGHADFIDSFRVRRGKTTRMSIELVPVAGILELHSVPNGAVVIVDGLIMGDTPFSNELEPGIHLLELRSDGMRTYRQRISLEPGTRKRFDIVMEGRTLESRPSSQPVYKNAWFWAGAGIAAVGIGVLAAVLASSPGDRNTQQGYELEIGTVR